MGLSEERAVRRPRDSPIGDPNAGCPNTPATRTTNPILRIWRRMGFLHHLVKGPAVWQSAGHTSGAPWRIGDVSDFDWRERDNFPSEKKPEAWPHCSQ